MSWEHKAMLTRRDRGYPTALIRVTSEAFDTHRYLTHAGGTSVAVRVGFLLRTAGHPCWRNPVLLKLYGIKICFFHSFFFNFQVAGFSLMIMVIIILAGFKWYSQNEPHDGELEQGQTAE